MSKFFTGKVSGVLSLTLLLISATVSAQFNHAKLQATGLTCALCSKSIHQALEQLPFVSGVQPELKSSSFDVQFKDGQSVSLTSIRSAVEDAGFFIGSLKLSLSPTGVAWEQTANGFEQDGISYRFLAPFKKSDLFQVIGKGFMTDKDLKRMTATHSDKIKAMPTAVFLLPVKK